MKALILGLAGRKGSGKSTLGQLVAAVLGYPCASFGSYVRKVASERALAQLPDVLQDLGAQLIATDCRQLCEGCLADAGWSHGGSMVVEGLRHAKAVQELRNLAEPGVFRLVFIDVCDEVLWPRVQAKGIVTADDWERFEKHPTEREVKTQVRSMADLIVDGSAPVDLLVPRIVAFASAACNG